MRIFLSILLCLTCLTNAWAQEEPESENTPIKVVLGTVDYQSISTGNKLGMAMTSLIQSGQVDMVEDALIEPARQALIAAMAQPLRFQAYNGMTDASEDEQVLRYDAQITSCTSSQQVVNNATTNRLQVLAQITLTDTRTGEIIGTKQVQGTATSSVGGVGINKPIATAQKEVIDDLRYAVVNTLNKWFPLNGHMLDKGLEKGKSKKLKEVYIDLGEAHGLTADYDVYFYRVREVSGRVSRSQIGQGVVREVQGDDISLVRIKKGADQIKQLFDNGIDVAVRIF